MTLNTLCLMLMTPYYKVWYRKLCCCCIGSCILCCFCDREEQKLYQDHIDKSRLLTTSGSTNTNGADGTSAVTKETDIVSSNKPSLVLTFYIYYISV